MWWAVTVSVAVLALLCNTPVQLCCVIIAVSVQQESISRLTLVTVFDFHHKCKEFTVHSE